MPIDTNFNPDFSAPAVCLFLNSDYSSSVFSDDGSACMEWLNDGYEKIRSRPTLPAPQNMYLQTYEVTKFDVRTPDNRPLYEVEVADPIEHRLHMQIIGILLLKKGLAADLANLATQAFDYGDPSDASAIETTLINSGVASDDYVVCLGLELS